VDRLHDAHHGYLVGSVEARDATEALDKAITQMEIGPTDRLRVGVVRE
jgi:hypothetical protein